jgi:hypothetical protein
MEVSSQRHSPTALPPGKQPLVPYPLYRRLDGPQIQSGRYGEEKNLLSPLGIKPLLLGHPAHNLANWVILALKLYYFLLL